MLKPRICRPPNVSHLAATLCIGLAAFSPTTIAVADEAGELPLGIVAEKPAEGPFVETDQGYMVPYEETIPGTDVKFEMLPIPGGKFTFGSPDSEAGRNADEGPQFTVEVEPFWMGKNEIRWEEYHQFMGVYAIFKDFASMRSLLKQSGDDPDFARRKAELEKALDEYPVLKKRLASETSGVDAITTPTELYEPDFTYEPGGDPEQPAVSMTQYAAKQYTKWLSGITGEFYRLPTEAEWEYACRAGSDTAYGYGNDPAKLGEYAWFADNSDEQTHPVGSKKPNAFGLHDMHGNAAEWVLDQYLEEGYQQFAGKNVKASEAIVWPTVLYPRVVRGGHWQSEASECRCASRLASHEEDWKEYDPNLPKSPWWYTNDPARGVGFRLVRQLTEPTADYKVKVWEMDVDDIRFDVADRLDEGRGVQDLVNPTLPEAIEQLKEVKEKIE